MICIARIPRKYMYIMKTCANTVAQNIYTISQLIHDAISVACGQVSPYPSDCEMQAGLESNVNWERNKAAVWRQAVGNARTRKLAARERQLRSMILAQCSARV